MASSWPGHLGDTCHVGTASLLGPAQVRLSQRPHPAVIVGTHTCGVMVTDV